MGCSQASTMEDCGVSWPTWLAIIWSTLMPEWMMAPLVMCSPDRRLPVWAGWMPWLVSAFTNSPSITLTFCLKGSSGDSVLESFMSAPLPSALQWFSLTPQPRNITAKRLGKSAAVGVSAKALTDSSHGRAMEQPAPFRITRRENARERNFEKRSDELVISLSLPEIGLDQFARRLRRRLGCACFAGEAAIQELRAEHNRVHQAAEFVTVRGQVGPHLVHQRLVRQLRRAVERIRHQL